MCSGEAWAVKARLGSEDVAHQCKLLCDFGQASSGNMSGLTV